jgi:DegV family protein with EDD domain
MVNILTDTTSCLSQDIAYKYNIPVIPQVIIFGEDSYYEGLDIDTDTFMQKLQSSHQLPKTAAPPPELFAKEFERLASDKEPILCIHPSSEVSGTVRSASVAAKDFPDLDIRVIDTRVIASPLGSIVELAAQWAASGESADDIEQKINDLIKRVKVYFLVSTLEYLAKGGRIGGAASLLGSVLQIKPILSIKDGKIDVYEKERTHKRAIAHLEKTILKQISFNGDAYLSVMHAGNAEEAEIFAQRLGEKIGQENIPITYVPPAIITHAGPGVLAAGFFRTS